MVMQHAELLRCMVEYLGDDKDLCSVATLSRTARDDRIWSPALKRLCQEFPLPECSAPEIPEDDNLSPAAPPGFVRLARHEIGNSSPRFNSDTGVLEFAFVSSDQPVPDAHDHSNRRALTWVPALPPLSCVPCRFTTDSHAEFNAHCHSWRHCENHMDPSERVPAQFVDPRHADPEGFARLPAVRQWAALHKHVAAVMRRLRAPLANAAFSQAFSQAIVLTSCLKQSNAIAQSDLVVQCCLDLSASTSAIYNFTGATLTKSLTRFCAVQLNLSRTVPSCS
eukprot:TRINITY_DN4185_c0_g1_i1.p1 TRINITY_DN4185_c0_g1~~TRINITY_DN4185_c0_g1_i1.p1  ORF type:complete len:287 (+),score=21.17 TRINITY_DN4185_c0_g1_i1:24-863(+)